MECTQCGELVPGGARFCPSCGHSVVADRRDERRVVTVVFADIVGFTGLSESLDPERVKRLVDSWFELLVADITEFGGRVDKIVGDGILALFGAPVAHEDDAERAVRAALRMQATLAAVASRSSGDRVAALPRVQMRIGVNTGEVLVGALRAGGSTTAMGDVVNIASRLQTAARPGEVLVGPATQALTAHSVDYERRGLLTARGREAPVDAWAALRALVPPGHKPPRAEAPLVGRDRELGLIDSAVAASLGHSRALMALVVGDTGVGKTRLVREAAGSLQRRRETLVLEGRCVPYGEANVWWPLAEALHGVCEVEPTCSPEEIHTAVWARVAAALGDSSPDDELDRITHGLMVLMGHDTTPGSSDPTRAHDSAVDAFVTFIEGHARRRSVALCLSDVHWADADLLRLVETLLERLARCPVIVLATARQAVREVWTPPSGRHDSLIVNLDPLDPTAAEQLLIALHGSAVSPQLRDDLLARSGGNPFFLEELVALVDQTAVDERPGLPDTLRGIVAARLDALSSDERAVLTDAAIIGRRGPLLALHEMAIGMHRTVDVDAVVATLAENELLEIDGRTWEFRSEIAREVAYATVPKAERAKRHAGIAAWMEARALADAGLEVDLEASPRRGEDALSSHAAIDDATVNRLAHHWAAAAELESEMGGVVAVPSEAAGRAVSWLWVSARRAQRRDLLPAALRAYDRALALAGPDPAARRIRLLVSRAQVRAERWDLDGARDDAEAALATAGSIGDRSVEAAAVLRLGDIDQRAGDTDAAVTRLRRAADGFAAEGDERGRGEALRLLGLTLMYAGDLDDAAATVEEAREALEAAGHVAGQGWAAQNRAFIAMLAGDLERTETEVARANELFSHVREEVGAAWSNGLLAFVRFAQGRRQEAEALASSILDDATGRADLWAIAMMRGLVGSLRLWDGRVSDAVSETGASVQTFRELGDPWGMSLSLATHGRARAMAGDVEAGFAAIRESMEVSTAGDPRTGPGAGAMLALAVQVGDPERVTDLVDLDGLRRASGTLTGAESEPTLAVLVLQTGVVPPVPDAHGRAFGHTCAALVAAAHGDVALATDHAASVPTCPEATYLDLAMADVAAGLALARAGEGRESRARLSRATATVATTDDRVGRAVVALARAAAAEAGGHPVAVSDRADAGVALARLGITAHGWDTAFALAVGERPRPRPELV